MKAISVCEQSFIDQNESNMETEKLNGHIGSGEEVEDIKKVLNENSRTESAVITCSDSEIIENGGNDSPSKEIETTEKEVLTENNDLLNHTNVSGETNRINVASDKENLVTEVEDEGDSSSKKNIDTENSNKIVEKTETNVQSETNHSVNSVDNLTNLVEEDKTEEVLLKDDFSSDKETSSSALTNGKDELEIINEEALLNDVTESSKEGSDTESTENVDICLDSNAENSADNFCEENNQLEITDVVGNQEDLAEETLPDDVQSKETESKSENSSKDDDSNLVISQVTGSEVLDPPSSNESEKVLTEENAKDIKTITEEEILENELLSGDIPSDDSNEDILLDEEENKENEKVEESKVEEVFNEEDETVEDVLEVERESEDVDIQLSHCQTMEPEEGSSWNEAQSLESKEDSNEAKRSDNDESITPENEPEVKEDGVKLEDEVEVEEDVSITPKNVEMEELEKESEKCEGLKENAQPMDEKSEGDENNATAKEEMSIVEEPGDGVSDENEEKKELNSDKDARKRTVEDDVYNGEDIGISFKKLKRDTEGEDMPTKDPIEDYNEDNSHPSSTASPSRSPSTDDNTETSEEGTRRKRSLTSNEEAGSSKKMRNSDDGMQVVDFVEEEEDEAEDGHVEGVGEVDVDEGEVGEKLGEVEDEEQDKKEKEKESEELKKEIKPKWSNLDETIDMVARFQKPLPFMETLRGTLKNLTRSDLEELTVQKLCEVISERSTVGELRRRAQALEQDQERWKEKVQAMSKQMREMEMVMKKYMSEVQKQIKDRNFQPITPLRVTRSVGLQVSFVTNSNKVNKPAPVPPVPPSPPTTQRQGIKTLMPKYPAVINVQAPPSTRNKPPQQPNGPRMNISPQQKSVLMPKKAFPVRPAGQIISPNRPIAPQPLMNSNRLPSNQLQLNSVRPNFKTSSPQQQQQQQQQTGSKVIDLTDDDDRQISQKSNTQPSISVRGPAGSVRVVNHLQQAQVNSNNRVAYLLPATSTGNPGSAPGTPSRQLLIATPAIQPQNRVVSSMPPLIFKGGSFVPAGPTTLVNQNRALLPKQLRHPAPLPQPPLNQLHRPNWKLLPPRPALKISKVQTGIVLSWNMTLGPEYESIASYQLYAYQESNLAPASTLWKKVGDVKALPLPMACTLTQFMAGHKYHFAVRAVDIHSRIGPFSFPGTIVLVK